MERKKLTDLLTEYGQHRFISVIDSLSAEEQDRLCREAELIDFSMLKGAAASEQNKKRGVISPMETMTMREQEAKREYYRRLGLEKLRDGRIGALLLAGGMGTRLGFEHAKGMYNIGETRDVFIFQRTIENLLDTVRDAGMPIRLFVMTSCLNYDETVEFFNEHDFFGYDPAYISFFRQDMSPCLDANGDMFLIGEDGRKSIAAAPNGNGGFYSSLVSAGLDKIIKEHGIEYINVFAVDNVLQRIADPVFVGAVVDSGFASGAKVVRKAAPDERVGAICLEDGAPSVVEYYEMTQELMDARLENGEPAYYYGVILNYLFRVSDIDRAVREKLPVHVVKKPIAGREALKLETLTLDMVHLVGTCLSFEVDRNYEFAPIKNAEGTDSVITAKELLKKAGYTL